MYRTGFGDCFLMSFGAAASARHVLIDFGVHQKGDIGTMGGVMDNIESTTGRKLALLVATHAHRDHISGFGQFADRFARFEIGDVWMPWTDNPHDEDAAAFERKQLAQYDRLEQHLRLAAAASHNPATYEPALAAVGNLRGNGKAKSELARAFGTGVQPQYLAAGASMAKVAGIAGLSADILAPSRKTEFLGREAPPASQRFLTAGGAETNAVHPFPNLEIRVGDLDYQAIVGQGQPTLSLDELEQLHQMAEVPADRLALALEKVRNNTSLVILFRFQGRSLLFPGDAQWGSWQSWIGTPGAERLLAEVDFLKVGHHGSENATPVDVVNALKSELAVMVPTQTLPFPTIPRMPLLAKLGAHAPGQTVVRSDCVDVENAPRGPRPKGGLPRGFTPGDLWIDYRVQP
jgi:hypothetical protein